MKKYLAILTSPEDLNAIADDIDGHLDVLNQLDKVIGNNHIYWFQTDYDTGFLLTLNRLADRRFDEPEELLQYTDYYLLFCDLYSKSRLKRITDPDEIPVFPPASGEDNLVGVREFVDIADLLSSFGQAKPGEDLEHLKSIYRANDTLHSRLPSINDIADEMD